MYKALLEATDALEQAEAFLDEDLTALRCVLDAMEDNAANADRKSRDEKETCWALGFIQYDLPALLKTAAVIMRDLYNVHDQLKQSAEQARETVRLAAPRKGGGTE